MVEPSGHCPYLGLKQNQAIRFASPTPEHRCYATGQAQEIPTIQPDYQTAFCLSSNHVSCPLYTGSGLPSTPAAPAPPRPPAPPPSSGGLLDWFLNLPPFERTIYALLLVALLTVVGGYAALAFGLFGGNGLLTGPDGIDSTPVASVTAPPEPSATIALEPSATASATPSATPSLTATRRPGTTPSPTRTPTASSVPSPTVTATWTPVPFIPTFTPEPTNTPAELPTATPEPPTATPEPPTATIEPSSTTEPTATATPEPPTATEGPPPDPARTLTPNPSP